MTAQIRSMLLESVLLMHVTSYTVRPCMEHCKEHQPKFHALGPTYGLQTDGVLPILAFLP
jgi:hypothetical protein